MKDKPCSQGRGVRLAAGANETASERSNQHAQYLDVVADFREKDEVVVSLSHLLI